MHKEITVITKSPEILLQYVSPKKTTCNVHCAVKFHTIMERYLPQLVLFFLSVPYMYEEDVGDEWRR